jgi:hypothetical protein
MKSVKCKVIIPPNPKTSTARQSIDAIYVRADPSAVCIGSSIGAFLPESTLMATTPAQAAARPIEELAAAIYVELVGRAFLRVENAAVIKPEPGTLATLSFELAAAFKKVERAALATAGPQNVGYKVELGDIAGWDK